MYDWRCGKRFGEDGYINAYEYTINPDLNVLKFDKMTQFIITFKDLLMENILEKYFGNLQNLNIQHIR